MRTIDDVKYVKFPIFDNQDSILVVYENGKKVPFLIPRLFVVKSNKPVNRGFHAHKACSQLLVVLHGKCLVSCDDGLCKKEFILNDLSQGILIPPGIWSEQTYDLNTVLMVLTDMSFDEKDYLRDYKEFLNFRRQK